MSEFNLSFNSTSQALSSIQRALDAVQNNVVNASTPGYAAERVNFSAEAFDPPAGLVGGVQVELSSSRDQYLEQSVQQQTSALGFLQQQSPLLNTLQGTFSASGDAGVPGALASFAGSFSALSGSPNDPALRGAVIQSAATLAQAFNQAAAQISQVSAGAAQQASSVVDQINALSVHIASLNTKIQNGAQNDAGVAADLNNSIETLSNLTNISVTHNSDGTSSVLLDGQTPLVLGNTPEALSIRNQTADPKAKYPTGSLQIQIADANGADVTAQATQGKLGALLQIHNQAVPQYLGDQTQQGELNRLAQTFASRVNQVLTSGQVSAGPPPVQGSPLFTYNQTDGTKAASSLAVSTSITAGQIATIDSSSSNGVATELADLTNPSNPADLIDGQSFTSFYGQLAGTAGTASAQATTDLQTQQDLTTQAQNQRTQASGVSLNDQAAQLLSLQQAYQATARVISIIETLSQTAVNIIPQA